MKLKFVVLLFAALLCGTQLFVSCSNKYTSANTASSKKLGGVTVLDTNAAKWLQNYEKTRGRVVKNKRKNGASSAFRKGFIDSLMSQNNVAGIRIYIALDDKNEKNNNKDRKEARIILMPVDANGVDLMNLKNLNKNMTTNSINYLIGTSDMRCPYNCDNDALERSK